MSPMYRPLLSFLLLTGCSVSDESTILYENTDHSSVTVVDYPVVADLDHDGSAEIVVVNSGTTTQGFTVYGQSNDGWTSSGSTWATHDFAVTNLLPDGTVPSPPVPSWQEYNVFRARPSFENENPSASDLLVDITDVCVADCDYGPVELAFQVTNQGLADVDAGALVAVYAKDTEPRLVATVSLPAVPAGTTIAGIAVELAPADIGVYGFLVRVDDEGTGGQTEGECDETNNEAVYSEVDCF